MHCIDQLNFRHLCGWNRSYIDAALDPGLAMGGELGGYESSIVAAREFPGSLLGRKFSVSSIAGSSGARATLAIVFFGWPSAGFGF